MAISDDFTHFDDRGGARMVNVGEKPGTKREAAAAGRVLVNARTFELIRTGGVKKGDVLTVAQIAGIMAAKRTPELIPMCHPVPLTGVELHLWLNEEMLSVEIEAAAACTGQTGVEMEALTAVSAAAETNSLDEARPTDRRKSFAASFRPPVASSRCSAASSHRADSGPCRSRS